MGEIFYLFIYFIIIFFVNVLLCVRGATPYGGSVAREFRVTGAKEFGVYYSTSSEFSKNDR